MSARTPSHRRVAPAVFALLLAAATSPPADAGLDPRLADFVRPPAIPSPVDNPTTPAKVELGRRLFFDTRLSGDNSLSCATCHDPSRGFEGGVSLNRGVPGTTLGRHTPTVLNLAWSDGYYWDGRAGSLEEQAMGPITSDIEMRQDPDALVGEIGADPSYAAAFAVAFGGPVSKGGVAKALAAYQRTLVSWNAPFDYWVSGNAGAVSSAAKRGFSLFVGKAGCATCHSGWNFTDGSFHDIGLPSQDPGRHALLPLPTMRHAFKTPGLRNIAERAPYMHDGSLATLETVVDHYDRGFVERPSLSAEIKPLSLTPQEKTDLVEFLKTLSGPVGTTANTRTMAARGAAAAGTMP